MMSTWLNSRLALYGGAGLMVVGVLLGVDHNGYRRAETKYKLTLADMRSRQLLALRAAEIKAKEQYTAQSKNTMKLAERLIAANTTIDSQNKQLRERANDVSTRYRNQVDAALQPIPSWIVTHGWVCDYNRAIGYILPSSRAGISGIESTSCTTDAFSASGVTAERILLHHEEYGAYCRRLEEQLNSLIDHVEFIEQGERL